MRLPSIAPALAAFALFPALLAPAAAQCGQWDPEVGTPGFTSPSSRIFCSVVHDDGTGDVLYVGGAFATASGVTVNNVTRWNGSSWSALGGGTNGFVGAMAFFDDGGGAKLYIAGGFTMAGGAPAKRLARWDGTTWTEVGGGSNGTLYAMTVAKPGMGGSPMLFVAGAFSTVGTTPAANIAAWNGATWQKLGTGVASNVYSMTEWDSDGAGPLPPSLYASGFFNSAGGSPASKIARWDGTSWSALGAGLSNEALAMAPFDDGNGDQLYVGGVFNNAGGSPAFFVARWNGSAWSPVGPGASAAVSALHVHDDGSGSQLYAGGQFTGFGAQAAQRIGRWDGTSWKPVGSGINSSGSPQVHTLDSLTDAKGYALFAGGEWTSVDGLPALDAVIWRGESVGVNYCTAKVTSGGCVPAMSASGTPSLSSPAGFAVQASQVQPNVFGLVFFSLSGPNNAPFQGGFLCFKSPFYRLKVKNAGGSGPCTGSFAYTLADFIAHPTAGSLIGAGSRISAEAWFRDLPSPSGTGFSDGLDFYVCP